MTKNILLLHNGNSAVKEWFYKKFPTYKIMPCFSVEWNDIPNSKIEFIRNNNNIICDLTSADQIGYMDLCRLKNHFHIVKVLSTYANDLSNLEDTWNKQTYDYDQWMRSSLLRLVVADDIFFYEDRVFLLPSRQIDKLVFSPGRCGTHVLKEITGVTDHCHHSEGINKDLIAKLSNASTLFVILRKNFLKFIVSRFGAKTLGITMLSLNSKTFESNKQIVKDSAPLIITAEYFMKEFNTVATFLDILIGCKFLWQKDINFCYLEDLSHYFYNLKISKNPYTDTDIIQNYNQAVQLSKDYQEWYDLLLAKTNFLFAHESKKIVLHNP